MSDHRFRSNLSSQLPGMRSIAAWMMQDAGVPRINRRPNMDLYYREVYRLPIPADRDLTKATRPVLRPVKLGSTAQNSKAQFGSQSENERGTRTISQTREMGVLRRQSEGKTRRLPVGPISLYSIVPLLAGRNTVVRSDNLPPAVYVHPHIGKTVAVFVGPTLGCTLFVIPASDNSRVAVHSNI